MTELKTLKDLVDRQSSSDTENCVYEDDLRQEAIKWVKFANEVSFIDDRPKDWKGIFKNFFNLTEEDLK